MDAYHERKIKRMENILNIFHFNGLNHKENKNMHRYLGTYTDAYENINVLY